MMPKRLRALTEIGMSRRVLSWATQSVVFAISGVLAFLLRFDFNLMTIPEACQLVLQASAIGKGGQI
jgi:hypothetical protein